MAQQARHDRQHDIVLHGATGFVGRLTAAHLARRADGARIALSGRSREKLERVRDDLGVDWPVVVADSDDPAAMRALAESTEVVCTTVGPYQRYGRELARACALAGTDLCDLTGEVSFMRWSADTLDDDARRTGARLVHACGFDSVPSDLGTYALAEVAGPLRAVTMIVVDMRGGLSGGTIDSMRSESERAWADADTRRTLLDRHALSPQRAVEPEPDQPSDTAVSDAAPFGHAGTLAPFFMASTNTRVVRRSNALLGFRYGRHLRYRESMLIRGTMLASRLPAIGLSLALPVGLVAVGAPGLGRLVARLLPAPGEGPSEKTRAKGRFTIEFHGTTEANSHARGTVSAEVDPGYDGTAILLGEAALELAATRGRPGGVLTPAVALGDGYAGRLREQGFTIEASMR